MKETEGENEREMESTERKKILRKNVWIVVMIVIIMMMS